MIVLTLYSRPGCHLCDEMKAVVQRVARAAEVPITIEEIDISTDADLEARYGLEIPVLLVDGKKAAKYRVTEEELTRMLAARAGLVGSGGLPLSPGYYLPVITKWPRRFCCQQASFSSLQNGCSLPLLTTVTRPAGTPRLTR